MAKIISNTSLVSRLSSLVFALLLLVSCKEDENLVSISDGYLHTGDATEITANSAVLSGSYNYYSTVGYMFNLFPNLTVFEGKVDTATISLLARSYRKPKAVEFPAGCPDSLDMIMSNVDVEFVDAGMVYSENRDFYESVKQSSGELKMNVFALKTSTVLKPATTYWYKTYIMFEPICLLQSLEYEGVSFYVQYSDLVKYLKLEDDDYNDFCVYGDTRSFKTLGK